MNYLDLIIACLIIIAAITGFNKGFIHQLASLTALILGIFLAVKFSKWISPFILDHFTSSVNVAKITAFIVIFILVMIVVHLLGRLLEKSFEEVELGLLNKLAGMVFSVIKMIFVLSCLMILIKLSIIRFNWPKEQDTEKSYLYKPVESVAPFIFPYLNLNDDRQKPETKDKTVDKTQKVVH
jgi:membrane protein required for colicin V production